METNGNTFQSLSLSGQVRNILHNHPDATLDDVEGLVTLNGQKASSIKQTFYNVQREMGMGKPPCVRLPRTRGLLKAPATITARQISSAQRLLNASGTLEGAITILKLVWQVKRS